jgi:hypothetical protein
MVIDLFGMKWLVTSRGNVVNLTVDFGFICN